MSMYCAMSPEEVISELNASPQGLTDEAAEENRKKFGANEPAEEKRKNPLQVFLSQFGDLLVIILIIAAVISIFTGNAESAIVILCVIIMNAIIGTVQHFKAQKSLDSLKAMSAPTARVLRRVNGVSSVREIPAGEMVVGDIMLLEAGNICPADGRLIEASQLLVNESALTGESLNVSKDASAICAEKAPLGDRFNMVYSGSIAANGRATAVVTAVGMNTEMGKIAGMVSSAKRPKTPLQESLDKFSRMLTVVIICVCAVVMLLSIFVQKNSPADALMFAVALAVAAIPEALSSIITISLAIGTRKMAKENAIVRDLKAVEGLGCISVICSDKTGTLTQNKMTVREIMTLDRNDEGSLSEAMALCSDACMSSDGTALGDPTETALLSYLGNTRYEQIRTECPRIGEIPFDSDRKLMSVVCETSNGTIMYTKGACDVILQRLKFVRRGKNISPITPDDLDKITEANKRFSENGMRVLAFAYKTAENGSISLEDENDFTFIGLTAMTDPPREESANAVHDCIRAGIKPVMITGDHKLTARAIAEEIGIYKKGDLCVEGVELDNMSDEELAEKLESISVYARVSPANKIRIVEHWQKKGKICAMTGDGVNDAPALKKADIGVAMGITGTEAAKDAASMVLADDNFATIIRAAASGRSIYSNIKNAVKFLISGNTAAIITVIYAALAGLSLPFTAVHLLFINLLTDSLPAIALCSEPASGKELIVPPRPAGESILDKKAGKFIAVHSLLLAAAVITAFMIGLAISPEAGSTMAFAVLCLGRLFEGMGCRSDRSLKSAGLLKNKFSLVAFAAGALLLCISLLIPPIGAFMDTVILAPVNYLIILLLAAAPFAIVQITRMIKE